jgi:molybdenum transport protein
LLEYQQKTAREKMIYFSDNEIDNIINEDTPYFDLTAELLCIQGEATVSFLARGDGIASGVEEAARVCEKLGLTATIKIPSGRQITKDDKLLSSVGDAKAVLKAWKPSQNILEYACAVATQTAKMIEAIKSVSPHTHFATTRKTIPLTKKLALKAVLNGGGGAHRLGLSESVLIFAQYVALAGMSLDECVKKAKEGTKEHKIAVEVKNVSDAVSAAKAGADIVQCDKLSPVEIEEATRGIKMINEHIMVIATGGINLQNAVDYAKAKPDIIVSSSVYYSKPYDIKVDIQ